MGDGGCEGDAGGPREKASGAAEGQRPRSECHTHTTSSALWTLSALDLARAELEQRRASRGWVFTKLKTNFTH